MMPDPLKAVPVRYIPVIVVEDPPPSVHTTNRRTDWEHVFALVRSHGGKWCRVAEYESNNQVGQMRQWLKSSQMSRSFEIITRSVKIDPERKVFRLFMRYIGDDMTAVDELLVDGGKQVPLTA